ncbi:MAG: hypothetical protein HOQ45_11935 [Nocardioidaceae bacterium]|nr:hypothetical protein [Nocardioidaceae bacterium]
MRSANLTPPPPRSYGQQIVSPAPAAGTVYTVAVTFPSGTFTGTPTVVAGHANGVAPDSTHVSAYNPSATGVTLSYVRSVAGDAVLTYIAWGS